jgi:hypothetical protein
MKSQTLWKDLGRVRLNKGEGRVNAARYEHYAGSQRQMVNQMRTGTVSRQTPLNVFERLLLGVSRVQE